MSSFITGVMLRVSQCLFLSLSHYAFPPAAQTITPGITTCQLRPRVLRCSTPSFKEDHDSDPLQVTNAENAERRRLRNVGAVSELDAEGRCVGESWGSCCGRRVVDSGGRPSQSAAQSQKLHLIGQLSTLAKSWFVVIRLGTKITVSGCETYIRDATRKADSACGEATCFPEGQALSSSPHRTFVSLILILTQNRTARCRGSEPSLARDT